MAAMRYQVPVSKYKTIVQAAKISAVAVFAVGLEFLITNNLVYAFVCFAAAILISLWPVRIDLSEDAPGTPVKGEGGAGKAIHPLEEL